MKTNIKYITKGLVLSLTLAFATSCVDLDPEPLSFMLPKIHSSTRKVLKPD